MESFKLGEFTMCDEKEAKDWTIIIIIIFIATLNEMYVQVR